MKAQARLRARLDDVMSNGDSVPISDAASVVRDWMVATGSEPHVTRSCAITVKRADRNEEKAERRFTGRASADGFHGDGILLKPSGFLEALEERKAFPLIQSGHRMHPEWTIGSSTREEWIDGQGLEIEVDVSRAPDVDSLWQKMTEGHVRGLSLGFWILDGDWIDAMEAFVASRFVIPEISVVSLPVDRDGVLQIARSWGAPERVRSLLRTPATRRSLLLGDALGESRDEVRRKVYVRESGHVFPELGMAAALAAGSGSLVRVGMGRQAAEAVSHWGR